MSRNMYPLDRLHVIIATCNMTLKSDCEISILLRQSCVLIGQLIDPFLQALVVRVQPIDLVLQALILRVQPIDLVLQALAVRLQAPKLVFE